MMSNSGVLGPFLLLLLSSTVSGLGSVVSKHYGYYLNHYTWQEAQNYCRRSSSYTDLATIHTTSDRDRMDLKRYYAWIGLHRSTSSFNWIWTDGGSNNLYVWANNQPHNSDSCAFVYYTSQRAYGNSCGGYLFFICHKLKHNKFHYTFVPQSKTWSEAQQYCKDNYHDLATFEDYYDLTSTVRERDFPVWTGLHRDGGMWKWGTGLSEYRNWASQEPGNNGDCVSISSVKKEMATQSCSARFPFVCFGDNLILVKENKTWEEALEHCRALKSPYHSSTRYELVSVQPGEDHNYVMTKVLEAITEKVWAGLRFMAGHWLWVNKADMLYSDLPLCPLEQQYCGALSQNDTGSVEATNCLEKMNFLCYRK